MLWSCCVAVLLCLWFDVLLWCFCLLRCCVAMPFCGFAIFVVCWLVVLLFVEVLGCCFDVLLCCCLA